VSFFDDEDDAIEEETRRSPRRGGGATARPGSARAGAARGGGARSGGRSAGSRRPPQDVAIERRRIGAAGVLIIVVILMILLISSCQARNTKNSLVNYNASVSSLINQSDATSQAVFRDLTSGKGGPAIKSALATPLSHARTELADAQGLSVPGQMAPAQAKVVLALQMRVDGISDIAAAVPGISGSGSAPTQAVAAIAGATARFYASDVAYKDYATIEISRALHGDHIAVGTADGGSIINPGQFLPELGWLETSFIDTELGVSSGSSASGGGKNTDQPGLHGDALDATSVGATTLTTTGTNTIPASPAPTFTLSVTNGGMFNEYKVGCAVSVEGGPSGKAVIGEITPGTTQTCNVTLSSAVTPGTYQVTVTVDKVLGETNLTNNTATYSVEFQ
jgi:hypothetical protein